MIRIHSHLSAVDAKICSAQLPGHKIVSGSYLNGDGGKPVVFVTIKLALLKQHNQASWHSGNVAWSIFQKSQGLVLNMGVAGLTDMFYFFLNSGYYILGGVRLVVYQCFVQRYHVQIRLDSNTLLQNKIFLLENGLQTHSF
jgi:hypothetical protein